MFSLYTLFSTPYTFWVGLCIVKSYQYKNKKNCSRSVHYWYQENQNKKHFVQSQSVFAWWSWGSTKEPITLEKISKTPFWDTSHSSLKISLQIYFCNVLETVSKQADSCSVQRSWESLHRWRTMEQPEKKHVLDWDEAKSLDQRQQMQHWIKEFIEIRKCKDKINRDKGAFLLSHTRDNLVTVRGCITFKCTLQFTLQPPAKRIHYARPCSLHRHSSYEGSSAVIFGVCL